MACQQTPLPKFPPAPWTFRAPPSGWNTLGTLVLQMGTHLPKVVGAVVPPLGSRREGIRQSFVTEAITSVTSITSQVWRRSERA
jgi:hypothetical protein